MALRWCICREEGNYPWFWQTTLLYLPWALSKSVRTCLHKEHQQVTSNIQHISLTKMFWAVQCKKSSRSFSLWIGGLSRKKAQTLTARNAVSLLCFGVIYTGSLPSEFLALMGFCKYIFQSSKHPWLQSHFFHKSM